MRKKIFFAPHRKIVNPSEYELRLIAKNRGIKNYKNMSIEKLLSTLDEKEHNLNTLLEKGHKKIAKMQNLLQNVLDQIIKMHDQLRDELEQIAKTRRTKNHNRMSKEELILALVKSKCSIAKLFINNLDNDTISE